MTIINTTYEEEMEKSYIDYGMSVIVSRAIPDVRDGLKPVHRRILYSMKELGLTPDKPHRKSARIVGEVLGKYHPHGDSSVYDAMVRLSQDFNMLYPLVDGHGNFGSVDGDSAAAMRYTEAKLTPIALELLKDMDKSIVNFRDNFDASTQEPEVLPALFPNLLVNGASGIAVGMSTYIPPHNLEEVINGTIAYIDGENPLEYIKGPDFPTGGIIANKNDLKNIYETGKGTIRIRAKIEQEKGDNGRTNLVISEIPYTYAGNKTRLLEKLLDLIRDKKLDEVADLQDESSREGIRIVLEVKRGVDIDNLLNKLYKMSPLEDTIGVNMLALVDYKPRILNLKEILYYFVVFQKEITIKKYQYLLSKAKEREEILQGLIKAQDMIDLIIEILRNSPNLKAAKGCLINGDTKCINFKTKTSEMQASKLNFTEAQANAILTMQLQKLIGLELKKLKSEHEELLKNIEQYKKILANEDELLKVIKNYLTQIKAYAAKRRTKIQEIKQADYIEKLHEEELIVLIDKFGYIKSTDKTRSKPNYKHIVETLSTDRLCIFTDKGNMHQIKVQDIPKGKLKDKGVLLDTITNIEKGEEIVSIHPFSSFDRLLFVTKDGMAKIVKQEEFDSNRSTLIATKLKADLILAEPPKEYLVLISTSGHVLKTKTQDIPIQKRMSLGVKAIKLTKSNSVKNAFTVDDNDIITINNKQVAVNKLRTQNRNTQGQKLIK